MLTACASMPPERVARRSTLEAAATECQRSHPVVTRVEIDSFDRVVAWRRETDSQRALDPFWQCVRDRAGQVAMVAPSAREPRIVGDHYVNEAKGFKVALPTSEWRPSLVREKPDQVADIAFERSGGWMAAGGFETPASFSFAGVNDWWIKTISEKWGWAAVTTLEQRDLSHAGFQGKFIAFEFTDRGIRRVEMTHHLWVPTGRHRLYRIRLVCAKPRCPELVPAYQKLVDSFALVP
jgi:hypothetical protein